MRQQTEQWGIRFEIHVNRGGYEWRSFIPSDTGTDCGALVLAPAGMVKEPEPGTFTAGARTAHKGRAGLDVARRAFNGFKKLAQDLTRSHPSPELVKKTDSGMQIIESGAFQQATLTDENCRTLIVDYASEFGTLWGDDDPRSLKDWKREAADFLDLLDVARALNTADFRNFERRIYDQGGNFGVRYASRRHSARPMTIASPGDAVEERSHRNALPTKVDFYDLARNCSSRERARMLLSRQINRKLSGGLSLRASMTSESRAFVEPSKLGHLLYMRMWLDTVNGEVIEREVTCRECGRPIQGTKSRKYCADQCRYRFNNRQRAANRS